MQGGKIREIYRGICGFPGKPSETELGKKREIETEWVFLEESKKVSSDGQIDQLNALRLKTQMKGRDLSRGKIGEISEMGFLVLGKKFLRGGL